jgi:hypothetical protein
MSAFDPKRTSPSPMKRLLANLAIALGLVLATYGFIGTPVIQDLLPLEWVIPGSHQAQTTPHYYRWVKDDAHAAAQSAAYLPYVLLATGLALVVFGIASRRKLRGTVA